MHQYQRLPPKARLEGITEIIFGINLYRAIQGEEEGETWTHSDCIGRRHWVTATAVGLRAKVDSWNALSNSSTLATALIYNSVSSSKTTRIIQEFE